MPASLKHLTDKKLNLTSLLALWNDGLYYSAAIVKCDKTNKKCLVCFEDGSEVWVKNRDLHIQLSLDQLNADEDIVCCVCDDGSSEPPNEIILCDVCQQGYHQKCHNPPVDSSKLDESEDTNDHKDWFCATCSYILNQSTSAKSSATTAQQETPSKDKQPVQQVAQSKQTQLTTQQPQPPSPPPTQHQQLVSKSQSKPKPETTQKSTSQIPDQQHLSANQKQPVKAKQNQASPQQQKATVGAIKSTVSNVQKSAPYYPLSNQARAVATSSTAALASLTASSALVVGSSAGRSKQDLVNQSQSRGLPKPRPAGPAAESISPPVKHAVRKSSVNFVMPVRQSALPTATRSVLPTNNPTSPASSNNKTPNVATTSIKTTPSTTVTSSTSQARPVIVTPSSCLAKNHSNTNNKSNETKDNRPQQIIPVTTTNNRLMSAPSPVIITTIAPAPKVSKNITGDNASRSSPNSVTISQTNNSNNQNVVAIDNVTINNSRISPQSLSGSQHTVVVSTSTQPTVIVSADSKTVGSTNSSN